MSTSQETRWSTPSIEPRPTDINAAASGAFSSRLPDPNAASRRDWARQFEPGISGNWNEDLRDVLLEARRLRRGF
jgi:hypothetical protein